MADPNTLAGQYEWQVKQTVALQKNNKEYAHKLVRVKALNTAFGPFYNLALKIMQNFNATKNLLKQNAKATDELSGATAGAAKTAGVFVKIWGSLRYVMLGVMALVFSVVAVFAYLTGSLGETGGKLGELGAIFDRVKNAVMSVVDAVTGIHWEPITTGLAVAFTAVGMFIGEALLMILDFGAVVIESISKIILLIMSVNWSPITSMLGTLFATMGSMILSALSLVMQFFGLVAQMWVELISYLVDTGAFDIIIDVVVTVGEIFTTTFTILGTLVLVFMQLVVDNFDIISGTIMFVAGIIVFLLKIGKKVFDALAVLTMAYLKAIIWLGTKGASVFRSLAGKFRDFVQFLEDSGFLEFMGYVVDYIVLLMSFWAFMISGLISETANFLSYFMGPAWNIISNVIGMTVSIVSIAITLIIANLRVMFAVAKGIFGMIFSILTGDFGAAIDYFVGIFTEVKDIFADTFDSILGHLGNWLDNFGLMITGAVDFMMAPINRLYDRVMEVIDSVDVLSNSADWIGGAVGGLGGFVNSLPGMAVGGIARGPTSGYPMALHGTEAVVPLPDGRTIPVAIQGGGVGATENVTFNINVSGGGDPEKIARAVSREVQRAFRTRSRSGGYGRGI